MNRRPTSLEVGVEAVAVGVIPCRVSVEALTTDSALPTLCERPLQIQKLQPQARTCLTDMHAGTSTFLVRCPDRNAVEAFPVRLDCLVKCPY